MPNLQIIIILLVVVAPILKQLYDKAQEQKELQRRRRDRTVSQRETLRTGRQPEDLIGQRSGAQGFDERARLQQLEADRLARIRAMREASARSAGGRAAPGQQAAEARRAQELAARRRAALEAQQRQAQLQAQQRQAQARAQAKRSPAAGQRQTRVGAPAQRVEVVKPAPAPDPVQAERRPASTFPKAGAVTATRGDAIAREMGTRAGVRRAIVMSEILRPPLALRSTQDADAAWKA